MRYTQTVAAAAAVLALAGCGASGATSASSPHTPAPATATAAATPSPALSGLELRTLLHECAADIEVGTANGHNYTGLQPHSPALPQPCRALDLDQLIKAIKLALRDMRNS